jgi:type IV secretory pathway TrbL component
MPSRTAGGACIAASSMRTRTSGSSESKRAAASATSAGVSERANAGADQSPSRREDAVTTASAIGRGQSGVRGRTRQPHCRGRRPRPHTAAGGRLCDRPHLARAMAPPALADGGSGARGAGVPPFHKPVRRRAS